MYLFIDANIFLSFYHLTSEDLKELEKLAVLIKNKEITLQLPQQIIEETWRNRATKINDSLKSFKAHKFSISYPAYCKAYPEYELMRKLHIDLEKLHSEIVRSIEKDIDEKNLAADKLITNLFDLGNLIKRTPELIKKSRDRMDIGNPPGKDRSIGDAINWESLLDATPSTASLFIIADDRDFYSPLDNNKIDDFLYEEWKAKKNRIYTSTVAYQIFLGNTTRT